MTCIVGVVTSKGVLLAGDAQSSTDNGRRLDRQAKVFQLSDVLAVGYCGSGRFGQILQHHLMDSLDDPPLGADEHRWVVRDFIPYLRDVTHDHGALHTHLEDSSEGIGESAFLLAVRRRLFLVWSDFGVDEHQLPFDAVGSGGETAMGSLVASLGASKGITPAQALKAATRAIQAASETTLFVGGRVSSVETVEHTADERALARRILGRRR